MLRIFLAAAGLALATAGAMAQSALDPGQTLVCSQSASAPTECFICPAGATCKYDTPTSADGKLDQAMGACRAHQVGMREIIGTDPPGAYHTFEDKWKTAGCAKVEDKWNASAAGKAEQARKDQEKRDLDLVTSVANQK